MVIVMVLMILALLDITDLATTVQLAILNIQNKELLVIYAKRLALLNIIFPHALIMLLAMNVMENMPLLGAKLVT